MVEFVFLFGPPCCGKTSLCSQLILDFAEKRYVRISPSELFYKTPDLSLHKVINRINNLLQKGYSVILDDTQQSQVERTRRTYTQSIKAKIPNCNFIALLVYPEGGKFQCCWANEFAFSEHSILLDKCGNTISPISYREPDIENWFLHSSVPKLEEGFSEIRELSSKLKIYQNVPFSRKVILLNACSILEFQPQHRFDSFGTFHLKSDVHSILQEYLESTKQSNTRVIILIDESSLFPTTLELLRSELLQQKKAIDHFRNQVRSNITQLASFIKEPIFYMIAAYNMFAEKDFFRIPNPGMVAWLQFRHQIDLNQAIYVGSSITKSFCERMGITFCDGEMFFKSSGWSVSSKISKFGTNFYEQRPHFLQDPEYLQERDQIGDVLSDLTKHHTKMPSRDSPVEEKGGPGRIHGICFPQNTATMLLDQHPLADPNLVVDEFESPKLDRVLPDWMFSNNSPVVPSVPSKKKVIQKKPRSNASQLSSECQDITTPNVHNMKSEDQNSFQDSNATHNNFLADIKMEKEPEVGHNSAAIPDLADEASEEPDIQTLLAKHFGTSALSVFQPTNNTPKRGMTDQSDDFVHKKPKQSLKTLLQ